MNKITLFFIAFSLIVASCLYGEETAMSEPITIGANPTIFSMELITDSEQTCPAGGSYTLWSVEIFTDEEVDISIDGSATGITVTPNTPTISTDGHVGIIATVESSVPPTGESPYEFTIIGTSGDYSVSIPIYLHVADNDDLCEDIYLLTPSGGEDYSSPYFQWTPCPIINYRYDLVISDNPEPWASPIIEQNLLSDCSYDLTNYEWNMLDFGVTYYWSARATWWMPGPDNAIHRIDWVSPDSFTKVCPHSIEPLFVWNLGDTLTAGDEYSVAITISDELGNPLEDFYGNPLEEVLVHYSDEIQGRTSVYYSASPGDADYTTEVPLYALNGEYTISIESIEAIGGCYEPWTSGEVGTTNVVYICEEFAVEGDISIGSNDVSIGDENLLTVSYSGCPLDHEVVISVEVERAEDTDSPYEHYETYLRTATFDEPINETEISLPTEEPGDYNVTAYFVKDGVNHAMIGGKRYFVTDPAADNMGPVIDILQCYQTGDGYVYMAVKCKDIGGGEFGNIILSLHYGGYIFTESEYTALDDSIYAILVTTSFGLPFSRLDEFGLRILALDNHANDTYYPSYNRYLNFVIHGEEDLQKGWYIRNYESGFTIDFQDEENFTLYNGKTIYYKIVPDPFSIREDIDDHRITQLRSAFSPVLDDLSNEDKFVLPRDGLISLSTIFPGIQPQADFNDIEESEILLQLRRDNSFSRFGSVYLFLIRTLMPMGSVATDPVIANILLNEYFYLGPLIGSIVEYANSEGIDLNDVGGGFLDCYILIHDIIIDEAFQDILKTAIYQDIVSHASEYSMYWAPELIGEAATNVASQLVYIISGIFNSLPAIMDAAFAPVVAEFELHKTNRFYATIDESNSFNKLPGTTLGSSEKVYPGDVKRLQVAVDRHPSISFGKRYIGIDIYSPDGERVDSTKTPLVDADIVFPSGIDHNTPPKTYFESELFHFDPDKYEPDSRPYKYVICVYEGAPPGVIYGDAYGQTFGERWILNPNKYEREFWVSNHFEPLPPEWGSYKYYLGSLLLNFYTNIDDEKDITKWVLVRSDNEDNPYDEDSYYPVNTIDNIAMDSIPIAIPFSSLNTDYTYHFKLQAFNDNGSRSSNYSEILSITTPSEFPGEGYAGPSITITSSDLSRAHASSRSPDTMAIITGIAFSTGSSNLTELKWRYKYRDEYTFSEWIYVFEEDTLEGISSINFEIVIHDTLFSLSGYYEVQIRVEDDNLYNNSYTHNLDILNLSSIDSFYVDFVGYDRNQYVSSLPCTLEGHFYKNATSEFLPYIKEISDSIWELAIAEDGSFDTDSEGFYIIIDEEPAKAIDTFEVIGVYTPTDDTIGQTNNLILFYDFDSLNAVSLIEPSDSTLIRSLPCRFIWNSPESLNIPVLYFIDIASDSVFSAVDTIIATEDTTLLVTTLDNTGTHYWRVRYKTPTGRSGPISSEFIFTFGNYPNMILYCLETGSQYTCTTDNHVMIWNAERYDSFYASEDTSRPAVSSTGWTPFIEDSIVYPISLTAGNGLKKLYLWVKDSLSTIKPDSGYLVYDSIELKDTIITPPPLSLYDLNSGNEEYTSSNSVAIEIEEDTSLFKYYLTTEAYVPEYSDSLWFYFFPENFIFTDTLLNPFRLNLYVADKYGNVSTTPSTDSILYSSSIDLLYSVVCSIGASERICYKNSSIFYNDSIAQDFNLSLIIDSLYSAPIKMVCFSGLGDVEDTIFYGDFILPDTLGLIYSVDSTLNGDENISIIIYDTLDNCKIIQTNVKKDNSPPNPIVNKETYSGGIDSTALDIDFSDLHSGLNKIEYALYSQPSLGGELISGWTTIIEYPIEYKCLFTGNWLVPALDSAYISIRATDNCGNSRVYEDLANVNTGLYIESNDSVYDEPSWIPDSVINRGDLAFLLLPDFIKLKNSSNDTLQIGLSVDDSETFWELATNIGDTTRPFDSTLCYYNCYSIGAIFADVEPLEDEFDDTTTLIQPDEVNWCASGVFGGMEYITPGDSTYLWLRIDTPPWYSIGEEAIQLKISHQVWTED